MRCVMDRVVLAGAVLGVAGSAAWGQSCRPEWDPGPGNPGMDGPVASFVVFDDGTGSAVYAAGGFTGQPAAHVARWDGQRWEPVGSGFDDIVYALAVFDDGTGPALYAGGLFQNADGRPAPHLARWGSQGRGWSPIGDQPDAPVRALAVFDDGSGARLAVGGDFSAMGPHPVNRVTLWDGQSWDFMAGGVDDGVYALQVFDDGSGPALLAGGLLTSAGGAPADRIARWDGQAWEDAGGALTGGVNPIVYTLGVHDDGSGPALYAGGDFQLASLTPRLVAKRVGGVWEDVGVGVAGGSVRALASFDDGVNGRWLYVGGGFRTAGGRPANGIAVWDGADWETLDGGMRGSVFSLLPIEGAGRPELWVGGWFSHAGPHAASAAARWVGCEAPCYPDCDGNGVLDFFDFLCFQNAFLAQDPYADCDGDGVLDFFDFLCFQNEFLAGCP